LSIPDLISVEACLIAPLVLSLLGFGILAWWDHQRRRPAAAVAAASAAGSAVSATALQLDSQATSILGLVRT
jgi:hypothetical protein